MAFDPLLHRTTWICGKCQWVEQWRDVRLSEVEVIVLRRIAEHRCNRSLTEGETKETGTTTNHGG